MKVVGGPGILTSSLGILLAAVAIKSIIFSILQNRLSFVHALLLMLAGNALTTIIGFLAAAMIGSGAMIFLGGFIIWPLCIMPARRILAVLKNPILQPLGPTGLAAVMSLALVVSCLLFAISSAFIDSHRLVIYWVWKLAAIYLALIVSILLTSFWEEWVIWKLSRCPADFTGYVQPVIRANLVVLLCVMLFAAGATLPKRLKSPNFLVKLNQISHAILEAKNNH